MERNQLKLFQNVSAFRSRKPQPLMLNMFGLGGPAWILGIKQRLFPNPWVILRCFPSGTIMGLAQTKLLEKTMKWFYILKQFSKIQSGGETTFWSCVILHEQWSIYWVIYSYRKKLVLVSTKVVFGPLSIAFDLVEFTSELNIISPFSFAFDDVMTYYWQWS